MNDKSVYIVKTHSGSYSAYSENTIGVFTSEDKAKKLAENLEDLAKFNEAFNKRKYLEFDLAYEQDNKRPNNSTGNKVYKYYDDLNEAKDEWFKANYIVPEHLIEALEFIDHDSSSSHTAGFEGAYYEEAKLYN